MTPPDQGREGGQRSLQRTLGIIAGNGRLPEILFDAAKASARPVFVVSLEGQGGLDRFPGADAVELRAGAAGGIIKALKGRQVDDLVMAGGLSRPSMKSLRPDFWTARFLAKTGAMAFGDDGLLTRLARALEEWEGFTVVGAHDVAPRLLADEGVLAGPDLSADLTAAARRAMEAAWSLGAEDKGQAAIANAESVLALEGVGGTARMLRNSLDHAEGCGGAVLAKLAKPRQDRRIDLPAIGPDTVRQAADAGLSAIIVEADGSLIIDLDVVKELAREHGIMVMGVRPPAIEPGS